MDQEGQKEGERASKEAATGVREHGQGFPGR
jgi:hypothetical protein